jgi:hypothetical protein
VNTSCNVGVNAGLRFFLVNAGASGDDNAVVPGADMAGALNFMSLQLGGLSSCCGGLLPPWDSTLFTGIVHNGCGTNVSTLRNAADAVAEQGFDGWERSACPFGTRIAA